MPIVVPDLIVLVHDASIRLIMYVDNFGIPVLPRENVAVICIVGNLPVVVLIVVLMAKHVVNHLIAVLGIHVVMVFAMVVLLALVRIIANHLTIHALPILFTSW
jgi:hypothetical protein